MKKCHHKKGRSLRELLLKRGISFFVEIMSKNHPDSFQCVLFARTEKKLFFILLKENIFIKLNEPKNRTLIRKSSRDHFGETATAFHVFCLPQCQVFVLSN